MDTKLTENESNFMSRRTDLAVQLVLEVEVDPDLEVDHAVDLEVDPEADPDPDHEAELDHDPEVDLDKEKNKNQNHHMSRVYHSPRCLMLDNIICYVIHYYKLCLITFHLFT